MCCFIGFSQFSFSQTANTLPPTGNVGVGTTTPNSKLDVVGNTKLGGKVTIDSTVIIKDSLTIKKRLTVDQDVLIKGTSTFVGDGKFKAELKVLGVAKMKDKLIVDSTVVMNSDAKIFGNLKIKSLEDINLINNRFLSIQPNGKVYALDGTELFKLIYQPINPCVQLPNGKIITGWEQNPNANYGIMFIGATQCPTRVGIGTNNPIATLDVRGNISMSYGAVNGFIAVSDANGKMTWKDPSTIGTGSVWQHNSSDIYFNTGNVGIGTTAVTGYMLSVEGAIRTREINVDASSIVWYDYILAKEYPLSSLQEVENYITKHHHLPNVPSEKEVKEKGINLGEMDAILLRKIEELTLYVIEQQKKIEELQNQLKGN